MSIIKTFSNDDAHMYFIVFTNRTHNVNYVYVYTWPHMPIANIMFNDLQQLFVVSLMVPYEVTHFEFIHYKLIYNTY
jgi:hypothetical protein